MKTIIAAASATLMACGLAAPASATVVDAPYISEGGYSVSSVSKGQTAKVVSSSCWGTGKGWKASLQVRKKGTSSWKTVQTVRPRRSDDCEDNSWTTVYSWTPRKVGTYELREKYSDGDRSRAVKVRVTTEEVPDTPDASTPNDLGTFPGEDTSSGLTSYVSAEKSRVLSYITSLVNKNVFCYGNALASGDVDGAATCQRVTGQLESLKTRGPHGGQIVQLGSEEPRPPSRVPGQGRHHLLRRLTAAPDRSPLQTPLETAGAETSEPGGAPSPASGSSDAPAGTAHGRPSHRP